MSSSDLQQEAQDIHDQSPESLDVSLDYTEERLTTLVDDYRVPLGQSPRGQALRLISGLPF
jgi:replication factor A1